MISLTHVHDWHWCFPCVIVCQCSSDKLAAQFFIICQAAGTWYSSKSIFSGNILYKKGGSINKNAGKIDVDISLMNTAHGQQNMTRK